MIYNRAKKCGDGSHSWVHNEEEIYEELFDEAEVVEHDKES